MGDTTSITWADSTFNHVIGCTKVAPGCTNCYAEALAKRFNKAAWGPHGTRVKTSEKYWQRPLIWNAKAKETGLPHRVFCASLADVFESWSGSVLDHKGNTLSETLDDLRAKLFDLIDQTPYLTWLLLTKRPENIGSMWHGGYRQNVWLGTSMSEQKTANEYWAQLLKTGKSLSPVLWWSAEPLLGPIDIEVACFTASQLTGFVQGPSWIVVGGESGDRFRSCESDAVTGLTLQCQVRRIPCFVKQDSNRKPGMQGRIPDWAWRTKQFPIAA